VTQEEQHLFFLGLWIGAFSEFNRAGRSIVIAWR
jgi:hypothetical protein